MHRFYELRNIAVQKPTSQSSTANGQWTYNMALSPSYANDGDKRCRNSNSNAPYIFSCTNKEENPFWRVDLEHSAVVLNVTVKNDDKWGGAFINPFDIRVGYTETNGGISNPFCVADAKLPANGETNFTCPETEGRYVSIHLPRKQHLVLCEVEVYGIYLR